MLSTPVAPTALASAEGLGPLCTPGDITNLTPPTISPSGSFVWASNTKTLTTTAGTWSSSCPVTYSYKWIREQTGAQVSSTSSYTVTEADATSRYTFHSEVMACDQAECSAWVPSSNSATLRISHPAKAVTFPCMTNAFDATYPWDDTNRITVLNAMKDAGVGWIRLNFVHWDKAETPHDNDYQDGTGQYLDLLKHCVNLITSTPYNMKVLLVIEQTPSWAGATLHSPPNDCTSNSSSCATFKDFLYHLLTVTLPSYQSKIAIQVWNEQNAQAHWTGSDDQYYFLLRSAYSKVKAINSSILVMTGGVSRLVGGPPPYPMATFVEDLYDDYDTYGCTAQNPCSTKPWSVVALHPYPNYDTDAATNECPTVGAVFADVSGAVLTSMKNHGDGGKPIWLTEFSWSAGDDYDGYDRLGDRVCFQADQVSRLSTAYKYNYLPSNVTEGFWWPTDRKDLADIGCVNISSPWACGSELLDTNLSHDVGTPTHDLYTAFFNVPPPT